MKDDITIVIPVYNRETIVGRTLESVAAQTWRPLNVILVDNNSNDGTMEVLEKWKAKNAAEDFKIQIISEPKPGACQARNAGLKAVETRWTLFFDSDDVMLLTHLQATMEFIAAHPDVEVVGWQRDIELLGGKKTTRYFADSDYIFQNLFQSIFSTQNYCALTSIFRRAGGWMPDGGMGDDVELGQRIINLNPRMLYRHGPTTVKVFEGAESITHGLPNRMESYMKTMEVLRRNLPVRYHHWLDLREMLQGATWGKDDPESAKIEERILQNTPWLRRQLWKLFLFYQKHGGRGVGRIYKLVRWTGL